MINTCIVGEILAISALLLKNKTLTGTSVPLLLWFGVGGRINFSGSCNAPYPCLDGVGRLIFIIPRLEVINGEKRPFWIGVGMGGVLVLLLFFMRGWCYSTHPDAYKILLDLEWRGLEL